MNSSSSISTLSSNSSSFSDLEPSLPQTLTPSHSSSSSSSTTTTTTKKKKKKKKKKMFKGGATSAGSPSPRSVVMTYSLMFCYDSLSDIDEPRHFLDSCFLCNKALSAGHNDIFMYGGDKPFCSEDCRQKQMDFDEKKEQEEKMKFKLMMKMKSFSDSSSSIQSFQISSFIGNEEIAAAATTTTTNGSFWT